MIYAIVTCHSYGNKIQFNIDRFITSYPLEKGNNESGCVIAIDDGNEGFVIHSKEQQENIFDNIIEIHGGKDVKWSIQWINRLNG